MICSPYAILGKTGCTSIYLINLDGSGEINLTEDPSIDSAPSWSPDSTYLAFHSDRNGNFDIFLMDLKEKNLAQVTFGKDHELAPALADKAD